MTIDKTMRLKEDLKVDINFEKSDANLIAEGFTDSIQLDTYKKYYANITKEFEEKKLTGKALTRWKFERYLKDYYATAKSLDRNVGKILKYLDSTGLIKNTVVIYTSDQGFYLGEHGWFDKRFMYEQSLKTAFLVRYPNIIKPRTRVNGFISNIDWAPTVLDMAGVASPVEIQGRSFLPLLKGQLPANWRKEVYYHYYEYPQPHHVSPHFGIRTPDFVLIRFYKEVESWELFDLKKDPEELHNIYTDSGYAKTVSYLKERLKKLILQYDDKAALKLFNTQL